MAAHEVGGCARPGQNRTWFVLIIKRRACFARYQIVNHTKREYARGPVSTNTIEAYFSIFKRGMRGIYQHCGEQHLQRYLTEFDFRYNHREALGINDAARADAALKGIEGKRLTCRRTRFGSDF